MSGESILSADMSTVGRWIVGGFRWWTGELMSLAPASLGAGGVTKGKALVFSDDGQLLRVDGGIAGEPFAPGSTTRAMTILVPRSACLMRVIDVPAMTRRDLTAMVTTDADRLMPAPAGQMLVAARPVGESAVGRMAVEIAGLSTAIAAQLIATCDAVGVVPRHVGVYDPHDADARLIDFLPAMRAAGMLGEERSGRSFWWAVTAFLVFANIVALIARDVTATDRMTQLVAEQQPAVAIAERMKRRLTDDDRVIQMALDRREGAGAATALGIVAEALPGGAWVQRFEWHNGAILLAGYKARGLDVIAALRQSPRLIEVRQTSNAAAADIPVGQPFELTARVRPN